MPIVIGLGYQKRSGKDTCAQMILELAKQAGIPASRRALADALKEECAAYLSPIMGIPYEEILRQMHGTTEEKARWRLILQWWGTEFRREQDPDYWIKLLRNWIETNCKDLNHIVVIPDVRFINEVDMCKSYPVGFAINVIRPGLESSDTHKSETELADYQGWSGIIVNDGDLTDLEAKVKEAFIYMMTFSMTHEECNTTSHSRCAVPQ